MCEGTVKYDVAIPQFGSLVMHSIECNGKYDCRNTILDETNCEADEKQKETSVENDTNNRTTGNASIYSCLPLRKGGNSVNAVVILDTIPLSQVTLNIAL